MQVLKTSTGNFKVFGTPSRRRAGLTVAAFAAATALLATARAADLNWDNGAGTLTWDTSAQNWSGSAWNNAGNGAIFGIDNGGDTIAVAAGGITVRSLDFEGPQYTIAGPGALTFTTAGASAMTPATVYVTDQATATILANITSTSGFSKRGSGVLELGGTNSFSGAIPAFNAAPTVAGGSTVDVVVGPTTLSYYATPSAGEAAGTLRLLTPSAIASTNAVGISGGYLDIGANNVTVSALRFTGFGQSVAWSSTNGNGPQGVIGSGTLHVTGDISWSGNFDGSVNGTIGVTLDLGGGTQVVRTGDSSSRATSSALTFAAPIINGSLLFVAGYNNGGTLGPAAGAVLSANNLYAGTTTVNGGTFIVSGTNATSDVKVVTGSYTLAGINGSLQGANHIAATAGGIFQIDSTPQTFSNPADGSIGVPIVPGQNNDRLRDDATVELRDGSFTYKGFTNTAGSETFGLLYASAGQNALTITPSGPTTGGSVTLTATNGLSLGTGATLTVNASGTGNVLGASAKLKLGVAPTLVGGIVPRTASSADLLTYDATNGLVPLAAASYATTLGAGGNVNLAASTTVFTGATVNAIKSAAAVSVGIQPGQKLSVTSGMILNTSTLSIVGPGTLAFGATPGVSIGSGTTTINAAVTGTAGLINSAGTLNLGGNLSALSGGIYVNAGTVGLNTPTYTGPVQVRNGTLNLNVSETSGTVYSPVTLGIPGSDANLKGLTPGISASSAPATATFYRPITVDNGGSTIAGNSLIGLGNGYLPTLTVSSGTGTQTFAGNLTLTSSLQVTGGSTSATSNNAVQFTGNLSGPGTYFAVYGRHAFAGNIANTGGIWIGTGSGNMAQAYFSGTAASNVPLTLNQGTATYTTASALPGGLLTVGFANASLVPLEANSTLANNISLASGASLFLYPAAGNTLTLTGTVSGAGIVTKAGAGMLVLPNDPTINLNIAAGTYWPTDARPLQNTVTVSATGNLDLSKLPGALVRNPSQTLVMSGGSITGGSIAGNGTVGMAVFNEGSTTSNTPVIYSPITGQTTVAATASATSTVTTSHFQNVVLTLAGTNTYSGPTLVSNTVLRGVDGVNISPNSNVLLSGGILEGSALYNRTLGAGPGQIQVLGVGNPLPSPNPTLGGDSGFSASGAPASVSLGGAGAPTLAFGSTYFNPTALVLNGPAADSTITLLNPLDMNGQVQSVKVYAATAVMPAAITNGGISKEEPGLLVLTATNAYSGQTGINGGYLRATDGVNIPANSNISMSKGGVLQTSGVFARSLGGGSTSVSFPYVAVNGISSAGFDAFGGPLTVNVGGSGQTLNVGSATYASDYNDNQLLLNTGAAANAPLTLANSFNLHGITTSQFVNNVNVGSGLVLNVGTGSFTGGADTTYFTGKVVDDLGNGVLTKWGPGTLVLQGSLDSANWAGGSVVVTGGTLALGTGGFINKNVTVNGVNAYPSVFDPSGVSNTYAVGASQLITVQGTNAYLGGSYAATAGGTVAFTGGVANAVNTASNNFGGTLTVSVAASGVIALSGTNAYSGPTYVNSGTLRLLGNSSLSPNSVLILKSFSTLQGTGSFTRPLGTTAGTVQITGTGTGTLTLDSYAPAAGSTFTVNFGGAGTTVQMGGTNFAITTLNLDNSATANGPIAFANPIDLNGKSATINVGTSATTGVSTATLTGSLTNSTGTGVLTKSGPGRLVLAASPSSAWTAGSIAVTGGTLALASGVSLARNVTLNGGNFDPTALGTPFSLGASQTLTIQNATSVAMGSYAGAGTVAFVGTSAAQLLSSSANVGGAANITVSNSSTSSFATATLSGSITTTGTTLLTGSANRLVLASTLRGGLAINGSAVSAQFAAPSSAASHTLLGDLSGIVISGTGGLYSPTATVALPITDRSTQQGEVLVTAGVNLGTFGSSYAGFVDVGNNDVIVRGGNEPALRAAVAAWYNGGSPAGIGIGSTAPNAGTGITTVAVIANSDGMGGALYSTYDGVPASAADVIVKYTYFGDTDASGLVDANDLANLLAGMSGGLAGWQNGDLNYDGVTNSADLSLLLNALGKQTFSYGGPGGVSGAIPEPANLALGAAALPLLSRRRRRCPAAATV